MNKTTKIKEFCRLRNSKRISKKALTPLMATVLLLTFALIIGTITMNVGKGYIDRLADEDTASSVVVISQEEVANNPTKELMVQYLDGKITKEEYDNRLTEIQN